MGCCAVVWIGCEAVRPPASLDGITPSTVSSRVETTAVLSGDALFADGRARLDDDAPATLDRRWRVWIGGVELAATDVAWIDPERIDLTIPRGLPAGVHDVSAAGPDGSEATLVRGLIVADALVDLTHTATIDEPIVEEPAPTSIATDPFGDGTSFAYVVGYRDHLYVGPSRDGSAVVRFDADGSNLETLAVALPADTTGNASRNLAIAAPHLTVGSTGCADATCGPDDEDGRGLLATGTIAGTEWLLIAGSRSSGDLDYVYTSDGDEPTTSLRYVDLSGQLDDGTRGIATACTVDDRWYLGFVGDGPRRPALVVVATTPTAPGLDASPADEIPTVRTPIEMVDLVGSFAGRLHVLTGTSWVRATVANPGRFEASSTEWVRITPTSPAYLSLASISTTKTADLAPIDLAIPQLASFGGRLFVARNTEDGPQLWSCDPALSDDVAQCDNDDWTLIARNSIGDDRLSQFDDPGRTAISMLVATADHLYVGYDDPDGLAILRTADPLATERADFEVRGGHGLGDPGRTRIFHAVSPSFADTAVYLIAGDGTGALSVHVLH